MERKFNFKKDYEDKRKTVQIKSFDSRKIKKIEKETLSKKPSELPTSLKLQRVKLNKLFMDSDVKTLYRTSK